jgi:uncharacterized membrane-anchored protein YjiN (DUF445 family)
MKLAHAFPIHHSPAVDFVLAELQNDAKVLERCTNEDFHRVIEMLFQDAKLEGALRQVLTKMVPLTERLAHDKFGCRLLNAAMNHFGHMEDVQQMMSNLMQEEFINKAWQSKFAMHTVETLLKSGSEAAWLAYRRASSDRLPELANQELASFGIKALINNRKAGLEEEHRKLVDEVRSLPRSKCAYYAIADANKFWSKHYRSHGESEPSAKRLQPTSLELTGEMRLELPEREWANSQRVARAASQTETAWPALLAESSHSQRSHGSWGHC